jgi:integrase
MNASAYWLAVSTGWRHSELGSLRWADLHLDGDNPFGSVRASMTKNHKAAMCPLRADTVTVLREWQGASSDSETVFPHMPRIERFRRDLKLTGVEYQTTLGVADFHALRKTFCTNMARSGVARRTAMSLMRHSDGNHENVEQDMFSSWSRTRLGNGGEVVFQLAGGG